MNPPEPPTILIYEFVTGGGLAGEPLPDSWAVEGAAMRDALAAEFAAARRPVARVVVTLDPRYSAGAGRWETVAVDTPERLETLAREADYTLLIAPETSGVLEGLTRRLHDAGVRTLGSSPEAVALAGDKVALGERLRLSGVPTPRSFVLQPGQSPPANWPFPSVLKPIDGAGSIDTHLLERPGDLDRIGDSIAPRLLQEFAPGVAMSASFLVLGGRVRLLAIGEQQVDRRGGRFSYQGGFVPVACGAESLAARAVEAVPGLGGLVGVDFLWDPSDGRIVILEINPRPTTSFVGLSRLWSPGALAEAWLAALVEPTGWDAAMDGIAQRVAAAEPVEFTASGQIARLETTQEGRS